MSKGFLWRPICQFLLELRDDEAVDHIGGFPEDLLRDDLRNFVLVPGPKRWKRMTKRYRDFVRAVAYRGIGYLDAHGYLVITDWRPIEEIAAHEPVLVPEMAGAR